jgi:hypothetical protein
VTEDAWIAYRGAVALIGDEGAVSRALMTGAVKSRGLIYRPLPGREELEDIPADLWAQWTFLPTFRGLSDKRRALVWLVPPRKELSPICRGYSDIVLVRADVERLVAPPAIEPAVATDAPQPVADIATANPRQSIDFDALLAFIKNHYAAARRHSERTNREKAKASAEKHLGRTIQTRAWRDAFAKAEINNNNGRPRNP